MDSNHSSATLSTVPSDPFRDTQKMQIKNYLFLVFKIHFEMKRRDVIKTVGGATAFGSSVIGISATVTADDWECNESCPQQIATYPFDLEDGHPFSDAAISVHWFGSDYSNGTWEHELGISGAASARPQYGIHGQRYGAYGDPDDGHITITANNELFGQYPPEDEGSLAPGWAEPLVSETIGEIDSAAGWFLAVGETLGAKLDEGHEDGLDLSYYNNGFRYRNTNSWHSSWDECCYYQYFEWEMNNIETVITIDGGFGYTQSLFGGTSFRFYEFDLEFLAHIVEPAVHSSLAKALEDPYQLTDDELEKLGIERVDDDTKEQYEEVNKDESPEFVATEPLMQGTNTKEKTIIENDKGFVLEEFEVDNQT